MEQSERCAIRWLCDKEIDMRCPHCESQKLSRSRRGNASLNPIMRIFLVCWRCRTCYRKFYRPSILNVLNG